MSPVLADLVRAIGAESTQRFIVQYGGTRLYLPQTADPGHPIAQAIGYDSMKALLAYFGNGQLDVPRATAQAIRAVHATIRDKHTAGHSANDLARAHGYTWRHIYRITAATPPDVDNLELPL